MVVEDDTVAVVVVLVVALFEDYKIVEVVVVVVIEHYVKWIAAVVLPLDVVDDEKFVSSLDVVAEDNSLLYQGSLAVVGAVDYAAVVVVVVVDVVWVVLVMVAVG